jgi:hypothetical protein
MSSERYLRNKAEAYKRNGIELDDKRYNTHHVIMRSDVARGLVPSDFDINNTNNLHPMLKDQHRALHCYLEQHPELQKDISNRVNLVYLAEIGELDHYAEIKPRSKGCGRR